MIPLRNKKNQIEKSLIETANKVYAIFEKHIDDMTVASQYRPARIDENNAYRSAWWNPYTWDGEKRPFTPTLWYEHFFASRGDRIVGTFLVDQDDNVRSCAIDIDGDSHDREGKDDLEKPRDANDEAQRLQDLLGKIGAPYQIARSRSGTGYHIWVFFSTPVPAMQARLFLKGCIRVAGLPPETEVFPKQDQKGAMGNLIARPGSHYWDEEAKKKGKACGSWYIDKETWQPVPFDEWPKYLEKCGEFSAESFTESIFRLAEEGQSSGVDPFPTIIAQSRTWNSNSLAAASNSSPVDPAFSWVLSDFEDFMKASGLSYKLKSRPGGMAGIWTHTLLLDVCPFSEHHSENNGHVDTSGSAVYFNENDGRLGFKCHHRHCDGVYGWKEFRARVAPGFKKSVVYAGPKIHFIRKQQQPTPRVPTHHAESISNRLIAQIETPVIEDTKLPSAEPPTTEVKTLSSEATDIHPEAATVSGDATNTSAKATEDQPNIYVADPAPLSPLIQVTIAAGWITPQPGAPGVRMREPGEDETEAAKCEQEAQATSGKHEHSEHCKHKPTGPKKRWGGLSFRTQQYIREYAGTNKEKYFPTLAQEIVNGKAKRKKTGRNVYNSFIDATCCAQVKHNRQCTTCGGMHKRPSFCERSALCLYCAKGMARYNAEWALKNWPDELITVIETKIDPKPLVHSDIRINRTGIIVMLKEAKVYKNARRFLDGYYRSAFIADKDVYFGLRRKFAPRLEIEKPLFSDKFTLERNTTIRLAKKSEVVDLLFAKMWLEPAKAFLAIGKELEKARSADEPDELLIEKLSRKLVTFPYVDSWHDKRTNPNKLGHKMFSLPTKKQLRDLAKAQYLSEHPEREGVKPGMCECGGKLDNGYVTWCGVKQGEISKNITEPHEVTEAANKMMQAAKISMTRKGAKLQDFPKKDAEMRALPVWGISARGKRCLNVRPAYMTG